MIRHIELMVHAGFQEAGRTIVSESDHTRHQFSVYFESVDRVAQDPERFLVIANYPEFEGLKPHPQMKILVEYAKEKLGNRLYVRQNYPDRKELHGMLEDAGGVDPAVQLHAFGELAAGCVADHMKQTASILGIPHHQTILHVDRSTDIDAYHPGTWKNIALLSEITDPNILKKIESLRHEGINVGVGGHTYRAYLDYFKWPVGS